jgi:hypothetical protein
MIAPEAAAGKLQDNEVPGRDHHRHAQDCPAYDAFVADDIQKGRIAGIGERKRRRAVLRAAMPAMTAESVPPSNIRRQIRDVVEQHA